MAKRCGAKREETVTIRYSRRFVKQLAKQPKSIQQSFYLRLELFAQNPYEPMLRSHALGGRLKGFYSINVTGDVRAIYKIIANEIYFFEMIGRHSQLYK